jgi:hypothetical protein
MSRFFECKLFVVQDIRSDIFARRNKNYPYGWRGKKGSKLSKRSTPPTHVVDHQTAGAVVDGPEGPLRTAEYTTANPWFKCKSCGFVWEGTPAYPHENCMKCGKPSQNLGKGAGMPLMPYHVYVPANPKRDGKADGRPVIYYCVDFEEETWHSGSGNRGVGCAFQGLLRSRHLPKFRPAPGTDGNPSAVQQALIYPIWDLWLKPLFGLKDTDLKGHFDFGKSTCPGDFIEDKIRTRRNEATVTPVEYPEETSEWFDTWLERQAALVALGYDCGKYGKLKNGVDGSPGDATRRALEAFQQDAGIDVSGHWDPSTEASMEATFKVNGLGYDDLASQLPEGGMKKFQAPKEEVFEDAPAEDRETTKPQPSGERRKFKKRH